ncbi:MAG: hypothetical protein GY754_28515 [bacterium]|nr:hypothetical protein [bacterium]
MTSPLSSPGRERTIDGEEYMTFTVKKSEDETEQIRIYAELNGVRYYMVDDGDGTYSLSTNKSDGKLFDAPSDQGSCLADPCTGSTQSLGGMDTIAIGDVNFAPKITTLAVSPNNFVESGTVISISTEISDMESEAVSVSWSMVSGTKVVTAITSEFENGTATATITCPDEATSSKADPS